MIHFRILKMGFEAHFFVFLICLHRITGLFVPPPKILNVEIWDGEATAHWSRPTNVSSDFHYNVEIAIYYDDWRKMDNCTGIKENSCDLKGFIHDYHLLYKVRVQLVVGKQASPWIRKTFLLNESKLSPPFITLSPTSNSLRVNVHQKPILLQIFPYGFVYTVYLELGGETNKNITAYIKGEDQNATTFKSLRRGGEYCVIVRMEYQASNFISSVSPKHCVLLPEQEWYVIAVTSLSILVVLAFVCFTAAILQCYLNHPEKTPASLKSPVSGWLPLSFGEGTMEVVTDKGWFLSGPEVKKTTQLPVSSVISKDHPGEERRMSMDSGVSMDPSSAENSQGSSPGRHDDSGCGSLSGSESSVSNQAEYPPRPRDVKAATGTGWERLLHPPPANIAEQDSAPPEAAVGSYRSQGPAPAPAAAREEVLRTMDCHPVLAEVVSGYRSAPQVCICSGAGWCTWCLKQGLGGRGAVLQADSGPRGCKRDSVDPCKGTACLSHPQKPLVESYTAEDMKSTFIHLEETFPMLTALAPQGINANFSLSLCDVQMAAD